MTLSTPLPGFSGSDRLGSALANRSARELLVEAMPELSRLATRLELAGHSITLVAATSPSLTDDGAVTRLLDELARVPRITDEPAREEYVAPSPHYETDAEPASAPATFPGDVHRFERFELVVQGPAYGNPFVDVEFAAMVEGPGGVVEVPGFYDGAGVYRLRHLMLCEGQHRFRTSSNARSLHGIEGVVEVREAAPGSPGPVRVTETFHFAHESGDRYVPVGTTAYAWIHQGEELEKNTLHSLRNSPFNKIRMCVFPKSYIFNENDPACYPFVHDAVSGFDLQRFDVHYWRHLEQRIADLNSIGVQADLILFHPYDRWGFADMGQVADDRYLRYAVARLGSFPNVWWSLANEFDLMTTKTEADWERFATIVRQSDPTGHLLSIHNCLELYDYSRSWVTHVSIQRVDLYKTAEMITQWRDRWGKPVVIDECAYEGNIDQGWGNITGVEMVRRFWEGAVRGGYVGHGETYLGDDDVLWWSKGGRLTGQSPSRIALLRDVMEAAPAPLEPLPLDWDAPAAGVPGDYYLFYYGFNQPRFRNFVWDPSVRYSVDVIDTWNVTVERLPQSVRGRFTIALPGRPYMALRFQVVRETGRVEPG